MVLPVLSFANTYYVSPNGGGDCSQNNPCSFQTALTNAQDSGESDTIIVANGTYTINSTLTYDDSDGNAGNLTIQGAEGAHPVLDGQETRRILEITTDNDAGITITVKGLEFKNGHVSDTSNTDYVCGRGGGGVKVKVTSAKVVVEECRFNGNQAEGRYGHGGGLCAEVGDGEILLVNNIFWNNHSNVNSNNGSFRGGGGGVALYIDDGVGNLTNNSFAKNKNDYTSQGNDCHLDYCSDANSSPTFRLFNNIFGSTGINITMAKGTVYFYNNWYGGYSMDGGVAFHEDENIQGGDPKFTDADNGDLHLRSDSPCIDVGCNTAPAIPNKDFEGDNRIIDGDKDGNPVVDMGADEFLPALLTVDPVPVHGAVKVPANGAQINCGLGNNDCEETYEEGTDVTLHAEAENGYTFDGWGGDCSNCDGTTCTITMDSDKNCSATFEALHTLTIAPQPQRGAVKVPANGAQINCGLGNNDCRETYQENAAVILHAIPEKGYALGSWEGDCVGCNGEECDILMDSDKTCTANFVQRGGPTPPASPAHLSASAEGGWQAGCTADVTLKWSAVRGATGYLIYNADTNQIWKWVKDATVTSYTFHNLPCGRTYHFYVRTHSNYGNSRPSKTVAVVVPSCSSGGGTETPAVSLVWPQNNAALGYNDFESSPGVVVFAWNRLSDAKGYLLWLKLDDGEHEPVEANVVLSGGDGLLIEAGDLAGIYFVLDKAGWNSLVPYTVTWQVSALSDPKDPTSIVGSSEKYSFTFEEASGE